MQASPEKVKVADSFGLYLDVPSKVTANTAETWIGGCRSNNSTLRSMYCFKVDLVSDQYSFFKVVEVLKC